MTITYSKHYHSQFSELSRSDTGITALGAGLRVSSDDGFQHHDAAPSLSVTETPSPQPVG
ncbi:hypothetical protein HMPREF9056_01839 [Actinomyces sp. oral taxon 170 str. F0386]|nr:hypothetical protein HMPREF9056_01839 [Actinomyces sp. oral taxon 170 str. F0386]